MTKTEKLALLKEWQERIKKMTLAIDRIDRAIGLDPDGPMFEANGELMVAYTKAVAALLGDRAEWLDWYWLENAMGAKAHPAGPKGKMRPIKTLGHLLWLIEVDA
jgi:hypothetical protein